MMMMVMMMMTTRRMRTDTETETATATGIAIIELLFNDCLLLHGLRVLFAVATNSVSILFWPMAIVAIVIFISLHSLLHATTVAATAAACY